MNLSTNLITNVEKANYIASQIGFYYYHKSIGNTEDEKISNTTVSIKNLGITDIEYENNNCNEKNNRSKYCSYK